MSAHGAGVAPISLNDLDKFPGCANIRDSHLTVKILPETMASGFSLPFTRFGVTVQHHASFVFYHRVRDLAMSESAILGLVMAHELGHLLLGEGAIQIKES